MAVIVARSSSAPMAELSGSPAAGDGTRAAATSAEVLHRHDLAVASMLLAITGIVLVLTLTVGVTPPG